MRRWLGGTRDQLDWQELAQNVTTELARNDLLAAAIPARALLGRSCPAGLDRTAWLTTLEDALVAVVEADLRRGDLEHAITRSNELAHRMADPPMAEPTRLPEVTRSHDARNLGLLALQAVLRRCSINDATAFARVALPHIDGHREPALHAAVSLVLAVADSLCRDDHEAAVDACDAAVERDVVPAVGTRIRARLDERIDPRYHSAHPEDSAWLAKAYDLAVMGWYRRATVNNGYALAVAFSVQPRVCALVNTAQLRWELGLPPSDTASIEDARALAHSFSLGAERTPELEQVIAETELEVWLAASDDAVPLADGALEVALRAALAEGGFGPIDRIACACLRARRADLLQQIEDEARSRAPDPARLDDEQSRAIVAAACLCGHGADPLTVRHWLEQASTTTQELAIHERAARTARAGEIAAVIGDHGWATWATRRAIDLFSSIGNVARPPVLEDRLRRLPNG